MAGVAALTASNANAMDLIDDRKARSKGFDIIYDQVRSDPALTKKRIAESVSRIDGDLSTFISKAYWTEAREELRRQVGTLRFDINSLAAQLPKPARKEAEALKETFVSEVSALDFAIRKKNKDSALKELADTKAALSAVLSKLG